MAAEVNDIFSYSLSTMETQSNARVLYRVLKLKGTTHVLLEQVSNIHVDNRVVARIPKLASHSIEYMQLLMPRNIGGTLHMHTSHDDEQPRLDLLSQCGLVSPSSFLDPHSRSGCE